MVVEIGTIRWLSLSLSCEVDFLGSILLSNLGRETCSVVIGVSDGTCCAGVWAGTRFAGAKFYPVLFRVSTS